MTTDPGTPIDALRAAYNDADDHSSPEAAARGMHEYLTEHGWELDKRPAGDGITFVLDPATVPHVDQLDTTAAALAHTFLSTSDLSGIKFGTDEYWTLMADNLQSLNWHVVHIGPGEILQVVDAGRGFATFPRGDRAVILPTSSTEPELAALSAMVDMLDGHDPGTQARMARYLADRYAGGTPEAQ